MSNHIHLLIQPLLWSISKIMELLSGRYSKYLNARLNRTGHVFQSRFKNRLCGNDNHLRQLVRYIHLNPIRAGIVGTPSAWSYSGHNEYIGRDTRGLIDQDFVLSMFNEDPNTARTEYTRFILEGLPGGPDEKLITSPIGPPSAPPRIPNIPSRELQIVSQRASLDVLSASSAALAGIPFEQMRARGRIRAVCRARLDFMRKAFTAGYRTKEIADYLTLSSSAVSKVLLHI